MKIFVAGATGATGRLLVEQLLNRGLSVKTVVRDKNRLPEKIRESENLFVTESAILNLSDEELAKRVEDCDAVALCLGHNLNFKGIYGKPRRLVTDSVRRLCSAVKTNQPEKKVKFVLMNTTGVRNPELQEENSTGEKIVFAILRGILPPHVDNEKAAEYLRNEVGQSDSVIEWAAVRPDGLIDIEEVTEYSVHQSPQVSPIFDSWKTSRINVAHFMAELITDEETWSKWKGQTPVIYNNEQEKK
jgi:NAD(P)-dependent dehydrogenase (short-subunit alcohol dehydrogenase family)